MEQAFKFQTNDSITLLPPNQPFVSNSTIREGNWSKLVPRKRKPKKQREQERGRENEKSSRQIKDRDLSSSTEFSRLGYLGDKIAQGFRRKYPIATAALLLPFFYIFSPLAEATEPQQQHHQQSDKQRARSLASAHKINRRHRSKSSNRESGSQSISLSLPGNIEQEIAVTDDKSYCSSDSHNQEQLTICSAIHDTETANILYTDTDSLTKHQSSSSLSVVDRVFVETIPAAKRQQQDSLDDSDKIINLHSLTIQLLAIVCSLLVILYLIHFIQKTMTNLLSKILGGGGSGSTTNLDRRRSLAGNVNQNQTTNSGQQANTIAQSHSSSTLNLPRNSSSSIHQQTNSSSSSNQHQSYQQHHRRASRSSVHSLSAMLISAITGGTNSNSTNGN